MIALRQAVRLSSILSSRAEAVPAWTARRPRRLLLSSSRSAGRARAALASIALALAAAGAVSAAESASVAPNPRVALETTLGTMVVELLPEVAPQTVAQFRRLVEEGWYDGKPFYRVVAGHVIQAGDGGENDQPTVTAEFSDLPHRVGAVGLARDEDPDSGSTEIYVCLAPRPHLDGRYTIFGQVVEGLEVLAAIGAVPVTEKWLGDAEPRVAFHEPVEPVVIVRARVVGGGAGEGGEAAPAMPGDDSAAGRTEDRPDKARMGSAAGAGPADPRHASGADAAARASAEGGETPGGCRRSAGEARAGTAVADGAPGRLAMRDAAGLVVPLAR